jgi:hypothetical protein
VAAAERAAWPVMRFFMMSLAVMAVLVVRVMI